MQAYRLETTLTENATLTLNDLPFKAGDTVEVTVSVRPVSTDEQTRYPLRGTVLRYDDPTDPVAEDAWTVLQ